jgi:hypothetical protein
MGKREQAEEIDSQTIKIQDLPVVAYTRNGLQVVYRLN